MLTEWEKRIDELSENFNREAGCIKDNQSERKYIITEIKNALEGASLVAQWLRVCLPMQGTWVQALVWEDPTCHGAAGPVSRNC